ncbi:hypothetical protein GCM10009660_25490 [Catellatospora bangladeshensis]
MSARRCGQDPARVPVVNPSNGSGEFRQARPARDALDAGAEVGRRRKSLFDNLSDRADDAGRDVRKAARRAFEGKKRKKGGARKWARRNNAEPELPTEQVALLVQAR